jgi:hypothetical protein
MQLDYKGEELALFEKAVRWKGYWTGRISKYIFGKILEVGAGTGSNVKHIINPRVQEYLCMEPDVKNSEIITTKIRSGEFPSICKLLNGTIDDLQGRELFSAILYPDVLEHIADDANELSKAASHLQLNAVFIILVPANKFLYSSFDKQIGHYRRYTKKSLKKVMPVNLKIIELKYLDSAGFFLSLMGGVFLRRKYPSEQQILFWDKMMIPVSKILDRMVFYKFGKSLLLIAQKKI